MQLLQHAQSVVHRAFASGAWPWNIYWSFTGLLSILECIICLYPLTALVNTKYNLQFPTLIFRHLSPTNCNAKMCSNFAHVHINFIMWIILLQSVGEFLHHLREFSFCLLWWKAIWVLENHVFTSVGIMFRFLINQLNLRNKFTISTVALDLFFDEYILI